MTTLFNTLGDLGWDVDILYQDDHWVIVLPANKRCLWVARKNKYGYVSRRAQDLYRWRNGWYSFFTDSARPPKGIPQHIVDQVKFLFGWLDL